MFKYIPLFCFLLFASCATETSNNQALSEEKTPPVATEVATTVTPQKAPVQTVEMTSDITPTLEYVTGRFDPAKHEDFVKMKPPFAEDNSMYLRKEVYAAFQEMHAAAKADGVDLLIRSATRNFKRQKQIWEAKWTGERKIEGGKDASKTWPKPADRALTILKWSSMPGTSRHHWGTDVDFNAFENDYFEEGKGLKEYEWLTANAANFGFCQPYTSKTDGRTGYNEEKWHWTYMPTSKIYTDFAKARLRDGYIAGFKGADTAKEIRVVQNYVLGINPACK